MLINNPLGTIRPYHRQEKAIVPPTKTAHCMIQLDHREYRGEEMRLHFDQQEEDVIALRCPSSLALGESHNAVPPLKSLIKEIGSSLRGKQKTLLLHCGPVWLSDIFSFLDQHPDDFTGLQNFKDHWLQQVMEQIVELQEEAQKNDVSLLLENTPICDLHYFEPGKGKIYPGLRTPQDLLDVIKKTDINLCFHSGHARSVCNVFTYMKKSRSLFAGATEQEVLNAPVDWTQFYQQISSHVKLIQLCDTVSLGDTAQTRSLPFREETWPELERFAFLIPRSTPVLFAFDHDNSKAYRHFFDMWNHEPALK